MLIRGLRRRPWTVSLAAPQSDRPAAAPRDAEGQSPRSVGRGRASGRPAWLARRSLPWPAGSPPLPPPETPGSVTGSCAECKRPRHHCRVDSTSVANDANGDVAPTEAAVTRSKLPALAVEGSTCPKETGPRAMWDLGWKWDASKPCETDRAVDGVRE